MDVKDSKLSRWKNDLENHAIHETLRQSVEWLDTEVEDTDEEFEEERRRLRKVLGEIQKIVSGLDGDFFPQQWLDQINQHLHQQQFFQQLQAYAKTPQVGHLQTANNHITQYAPQVFHLSAMTRPVESAKVIKMAEEAFSSFSESMEAKANGTDTRFVKSEAALKAVDEKSTALEQRLDELETTASEKLSEWQNAFTEKQTTRDQQHSDAQIERETKFEELLSEWKEEVETQRAKISAKQTDKLQATLDHFKETGEAVLKDVNEKHQSVLEIHKLVGRDSVAGGYQKSAGEEKTEANRWRWISLGCLLAAVVWLGIKYWSGFERVDSGGLNWPEIVTASSLTAIFLVAAGYTSRQSKIHRDNERQLRSYALETKALDPFIASLEPTEQQAIKAELVRRMFGQQNAQTKDKLASVDDATLKTALEKLPDAVARAVKRVI
jgi:hypothetical protein